MTLEQQLANVQAAIQKILATGQRVRKGDREVEHARLSDLQVQEAQLQQQLAARKRGRNRINYVKI